ncbi:MAG: aminoglycoside phosphotransferase [Kineosporiaceae bacterium]
MTVPAPEPTADPLESLLAEWLPRRRWYPAKGRAVTVRLVADLPLPSPDDADVRVLVVALEGGSPDAGLARGAAEEAVHVQVPVVLRRVRGDAGPVGPAPAVIGALPSPAGPVHVHDGAHDPAYAAALVTLLAAPTSLRSASGWVRSEPGPAAPRSAGTAAPPARVLTGEQSNTSVIVEPAGEPPLIVKVFRSLQAGDNPDVALQTALAAAGSERVAPPAGHVRAGWVGRHGEEVVADLAFASRFLPGAPDAWRTATAALAEGASFDAEAHELGAVTAEVHQVLARAFPAEPATPARLARLADSLAARVRWAVAAAELAGVAAAATDIVQRVRSVTRAPAWQRIHGDLHLGQVLRPPGRGWVLLDFEGEPLRPLSERTALDTPLRDVASMLRSFDYAAGRAASGPAEAAAAARAWAGSAREAFCDGYADVAGDDPRGHGVLLQALELEKALYEVVYETRNRPDWVDVPLAAVRRLTT